MEDKKPLDVDLDELCQAMEDGSYERDYYLDLDNGEILFLSEYTDDEETAKLKDEIEGNPDRYELIPKADSDEGYKDMLDFMATVTDEHLAELLEVAINGRGAFRRFKDVLTRYPKEQGRWFRFRDERSLERALEWLEEIGVTLVEE
jgi:hypothetical protein